MAPKSSVKDHAPVIGAVAALVTAFAALVASWPKSDPGPARREPSVEIETPAAPSSDAETEAPLPASVGGDEIAPSEPSQAPGRDLVAPRIKRAPPSSLPIVEPDWQRAVVSSSRIELYMRSEPSSVAPALSRITPKQVVHVAPHDEKWLKAMLPNGERGYVDKEFVMIIGN